ncbi:MAG: PepSY domain-containing protein, partial [Chloroflexota bacterium]
MQQNVSSRVDMPQDSDVPTTTPQTVSSQTKLYRAVWRWHFYAGLFVIPFSIILAVTGSIYLFRPYIEPMLYAHLYNVTPQPTSLFYEAQIAAVQQTFPGAQITHITPVHTAGSSTEVELRVPEHGGMYAYVDPHNGEVLGSLVRDDMFMQRVREIHGELLMGNFGEGIVELVACWAIVL